MSNNRLWEADVALTSYLAITKPQRLVVVDERSFVPMLIVYINKIVLSFILHLIYIVNNVHPRLL